MTATYDPIATTTLGSAASTITFSSIPNTFTDLRLVFVATPTSSSWVSLRVNSDTGSNYSQTLLLGNGTQAQSNRYTSQNDIYIAPFNLSTTIPTFISVDLFSYTGSTNKTFLSNFNGDANGSGFVGNTVALWRNTAVVTRLDISAVLPTGNFASGTTATLYGIKSE